jgi:hypothetical protein
VLLPLPLIGLGAEYIGMPEIGAEIAPPGIGGSPTFVPETFPPEHAPQRSKNEIARVVIGLPPHQL